MPRREVAGCRGSWVKGWWDRRYRALLLHQWHSGLVLHRWPRFPSHVDAGRRSVVASVVAFGRSLDDNGGVIELTEPQVWVLIGVFATAIFGMLSWQTVSFNRTLTMAIGSLRTELGAEVGSLRTELRTEVGSLRREMEFFRESVDAKFDTVNHKIDSLDRDVQALTRHVFGTDPR